MNILNSEILPELKFRHEVVHNIDEFSAHFPSENYIIDQIDVGGMSGAMTFVNIGELIVGRCDGDKRIYVRGQFEPGCCSFSVVHAGNVGSRWRGRNLTEGDINFLPADLQFNHLTASKFETSFFVMPQTWLNDVGRSAPGHVQQHPLELIKNLNRLVDSLRKGANGEQECYEIVDIVRALTGLIVDRELIYQLPADENRRKDLLFEALDYIYSNREEPIALIDLYKTLGISERSLHYAFQQTLGVSPAQFVRSIRLNHVHRALRESARDTTISSVVEAHGFQYSGEFASTYKTMFGELPSDTLGKSKN